MIDYLIIKPGNQIILYGETSFKLSAIEPPYWPLLLGSYLRHDGRHVEIIDLEVDGLDELAYIVVTERPTNVIICISGHNPNASMMNMVGLDELTERIRSYSPYSTIHLHGLYPSVRAQHILKKHKYVNNVIIGEGLTYLSILNNYKRTNEITINDIPTIDWSFVNIRKYRAHNWHCFGNIENRSPYGVLYTSWGCPYNCDFCCIHSMHRNIQQRDIDLVFEDLKKLYIIGVRNIKIMDELFTMNKRRVLELCYKIIENKMTNLNMWAYARTDTIDSELVSTMLEAGIRWLGIGYESGSQNILNVSQKKQTLEKAYKATEICKKHGMNICGNFVFGLLEDNYETMKATLDLAIELQPEWANFNVVQAFPGTKLYEKVKKRPWFKEPEHYEQYSQHGYYATPMGTEYLTPEEVLRFKDQAFRDFFMHESYLQMIESKFGIETRKHIENDFNYYPKRKILGD